MPFDAARLREHYPFASRWFERGGLRLHYLDEGTGDPVVMLHGNPSWSFMYRELVKQLRGSHRVVAPDHIGCGLSDKPGDERYSYTLESRVDDLEALLDGLGIAKDVTLVLHDWGGMIGMAWAHRHPERVRRIVVMNTAAFLLPPGKRLPPALKLCRDSRLGALLVRGLNAFSSIASLVCVKRRPMTPDIRAGYVGPYDSWANRIATLRFVQDIPLDPADRAWPVVRDVQDGLDRFRELPMLICWGERDFVFDEHFLREWLVRFPSAEVRRVPDGGHYIVEDAPEIVIPAVKDFLARHPLREASRA